MRVEPPRRGAAERPAGDRTVAVPDGATPREAAAIVAAVVEHLEADGESPPDGRVLDPWTRAGRLTAAGGGRRHPWLSGDSR